MDPLDNPLTTCPIQTDCEMSIEPYLNTQFGFVDDPDRQFGKGSVPTRARTQSAHPKLLLTLAVTVSLFLLSIKAANTLIMGK